MEKFSTTTAPIATKCSASKVWAFVSLKMSYPILALSETKKAPKLKKWWAEDDKSAGCSVLYARTCFALTG